MGKFLKVSILAAGLLCLGVLQSAKADTVSFTVTVTNATGGPCIGIATCAQTILGVGGSETATATFTSGGGFSLTETSAALGAGGSAVSATLSTPLEALTSGFGPVLCSSATPNFTVVGTTLTPVATSPINAECSASTAFTFPGSALLPQSGAGFLTSNGGGVWTLTDNSFALKFTVTPTSTPEPSSLLMLGSGLLGLIGFGLRRKGIA